MGGAAPRANLEPLLILFFLLAGSGGIGIDQALAVLFQAIQDIFHIRFHILQDICRIGDRAGAELISGFVRFLP